MNAFPAGTRVLGFFPRAGALFSRPTVGPRTSSARRHRPPCTSARAVSGDLHTHAATVVPSRVSSHEHERSAMAFALTSPRHVVAPPRALAARAGAFASPLRVAATPISAVRRDLAIEIVAEGERGRGRGGGRGGRGACPRTTPPNDPTAPSALFVFETRLVPFLGNPRARARGRAAT